MAQSTDQLTYEGIQISMPEPWSSHQQTLVRALAHEIRSTLASARICAEALADQYPPPEDRRRRYAATIAEQTSHIAHLLDDFIAVVNYESETELPSSELVDINSAVWEATNQLYSLAQQRCISLKLVPSPSTSIVQGTGARLTQAFRGCLEYMLRTVAESSQVRVVVEHVTGSAGQPAVEVRIECTQAPPSNHRLRLLTASAWDAITLRAVQHIVTAHQGCVEALGADATGLRGVLPPYQGTAAGQLPATGRWRAQTGPDYSYPQARAMGL